MLIQIQNAEKGEAPRERKHNEEERLDDEEGVGRDWTEEGLGYWGETAMLETCVPESQTAEEQLKNWNSVCLRMLSKHNAQTPENAEQAQCSMLRQHRN